MSQGMLSRRRQLIEDIQKASIDGVAPYIDRNRGKALYMRADRLGVKWADACEMAGIMTRRDANKSPNRETPALTEEEKRAAAEKHKKMLEQKRCARCIWSIRAGERTVFCPAPKGYCMAKRKPGKRYYGTFGDQ